ncbi:hypothetical protein D3C87_1776600 [compost metagenome]
MIPLPEPTQPLKLSDVILTVPLGMFVKINLVSVISSVVAHGTAAYVFWKGIVSIAHNTDHSTIPDFKDIPLVV